jgi:hypothetical protein
VWLGPRPSRAERGRQRRYLSRLVRYLAAEAGIRQFFDIGTGLPTSPNVHEVAQGIIPEARIVYVDNDCSIPGFVHARGPTS